MIVYKKWRYPFNFATLAFAFILFTISFSKFKMPHYVFMLLPLAALFTAPYLRLILSYKGGIRFYYPLQLVLAVLVIIVTIALNYYFLPPSVFGQIAGALLIIAFLILLFRKSQHRASKVVYLTACIAILFNLFMNYNFFPNLLKYQGGNELAFQMRKENNLIDDRDIILLDVNAHSFDFYRSYNHDIVDIGHLGEKLPSLQNKYFLLTAKMTREAWADSFTIKPVISHVDYNVTTLKLKFLNPKTRTSKLDTLMLAQIAPKKP
jgi:hypothetical protein